MGDEMFDALVLVAPPKLLGELRENMSRGLQKKVLAELNKDFVHLGATELARRLLPELPPNIH